MTVFGAFETLMLSKADASDVLLHCYKMCALQAMLEAAEKVAGASPRIAVFDRKRKIELALKLQQRWQRWELTNFDYLMQVCPATQPSSLTP